ncbi:MAG: hypothetical protein KAT69_10655 [Candidatus Aminicenantes bacterium]|nr:hypothetical protein [Candidatus Aminicenantes bacterium]
MKEYIEKIIEIILENISCEHQEIEEYPRGPKQDNPTYFLEDEKAVIEKCLKAMPDIEEKARELFAWSADPRTIKECEDFIRSLLKEESCSQK